MSVAIKNPKGPTHDNGDSCVRLSRPAVERSRKTPPPYGCGPVSFAGTEEALYVVPPFDNVSPNGTAARGTERFEGIPPAPSGTFLSQRWLLTEDTYECEDAKRVYYLSMESFSFGRSLANNVTNLLLDLAKVIIKFINNLAGTIDGDPAMRGRVQVVPCPTSVVAERLIPASCCFQPDLDRRL